MTITDEHLEADSPINEESGEAFDRFVSLDSTVPLLDAKVIRDGDDDEWKTFVLKNRMRRAFEAGLDKGKELKAREIAVRIGVS